MTNLTWVLLGLFLICLGIFVGMRLRKRDPKRQFATAAMSAVVSCLTLGTTASSGGLASEIASKVSVALGWGPMEGAFPSVIAFGLTIAAMVAIVTVAVTALKTWDAPPRVSEIELSEKHLQNSLIALTASQLNILLTRSKDPIASDAAVNWQEKLPETPPPVQNKDLLKDLLLEGFKEIEINEADWRDEGKLWVGKKLGIRPNDTRELVALIFDEAPTNDLLCERISALGKQGLSLEGFKIYALFSSENDEEEIANEIEVLGHNVEVLSSSTMILMGLDLRSYARKLLQSFQNTKVGGTQATLANSYVDLKINQKDSLCEPIEISSKLESFSAEESNAHLAIIGQYGQGKSTALLKFCCDWAQRFIENGDLSEPIPLLIELRGKSPSEMDPLDFLSTWCSRYGLAPQQVLNLVKAGKAIMIFEGFDELRNAGREFSRHQHFNALWRFAYPGTKLVFTGRPNFFLDDRETNRTLRTESSRIAAGDAFTDLWLLEMLEKDQIKDACRSYETDVRVGILDAVDANDEFLDILSRPSMLPIVATIWDEIDELKNEQFSLTGAALLERYIQATFARKEAELERDRIQLGAPTGSRYLVLPKQVREMLTVCVAWRMSGQNAKNTISRDDIRDMIREVYSTLFSITKSETASPEIIDGMVNFEKRFSDLSQAERVDEITSEICSAGLLIPDPAGGNSNLRFPHKMFFEYLIAKSACIVDKRELLNSRILLNLTSRRSNLLNRFLNEPQAMKYYVDCSDPYFKRALGFWKRASILTCMLWVVLKTYLSLIFAQLLSTFSEIAKLINGNKILNNVSIYKIITKSSLDKRIKHNMRYIVFKQKIRRYSFFIRTYTVFLMIMLISIIKDGSVPTSIIILFFIFLLISIFEIYPHKDSVLYFWYFCLYYQTRNKGRIIDLFSFESYLTAFGALKSRSYPHDLRESSKQVDPKYYLYPSEDFDQFRP